MSRREAFARAESVLIELGLASTGRRPVGEWTPAHARCGTTIVWATRRLDELEGLARNVTLLAAGRVRYAGTVAGLAARSWAHAA
jgi:ABC-type multidrug transport system ATPase subunit